MTWPGDNITVAREARVLVLAVKPHLVPAVLTEVKSVVDPTHTLFVSVAAGVTLDTLQSL
jgi:pyrroline-5-carboxylate reductase